MYSNFYFIHFVFNDLVDLYSPFVLKERKDEPEPDELQSIQNIIILEVVKRYQKIF